MVFLLKPVSSHRLPFYYRLETWQLHDIRLHNKNCAEASVLFGVDYIFY